MLERTNLDKQLLKVISRNANVFTNQEKEICNLELVEFSNFSWKAANILNKLFKGVKTKLIKDEEKLIKGKIINRKALYFVLKKENITLATSINQLLQGY